MYTHNHSFLNVPITKQMFHYLLYHNQALYIIHIYNNINNKNDNSSFDTKHFVITS